MVPLPDVQTLIDVVRGDAASDDPLDELAQAARSVAEIEAVSDGLLGHFVESCRSSGYSWSEISSVLGVSKQAVHKRFAGLTPTFERFTPRARSVVRDAVEEARALGQPSVGTEHLLLALFRDPDGLAAQVMGEAGLRREAVAASLPAAHSDTGADPVVGEIGYSPRARTVLRNAVEAALMLGHNYVGTEHILLALFDDAGARAAEILGSLGATHQDMEERLAAKFAAIKASRKRA